MDKIEESLDKISNEKYLDTPPQRIFPELKGISKYQEKRKVQEATSSSKKESIQPMISEEGVGNVIDKLRESIEDKDEMERKEKRLLRKDNVTTEEVVDIINEQRKEQKLIIPYQRYSSPSNLSASEKLQLTSPKLKELEAIFTLAGESMEWEKIEKEAVVEETNKGVFFAVGSGPEEHSKTLVELTENKIKKAVT